MASRSNDCIFPSAYGLRDANAYVLVYDLLSPESFEYISSLFNQINESRDLSHVPVVVVGNKTDKVTCSGRGSGVTSFSNKYDAFSYGSSSSSSHSHSSKYRSVSGRNKYKEEEDSDFGSHHDHHHDEFGSHKGFGSSHHHRSSSKYGKHHKDRHGRDHHGHHSR